MKWNENNFWKVEILVPNEDFMFQYIVMYPDGGFKEITQALNFNGTLSYSSTLK